MKTVDKASINDPHRVSCKINEVADRSLKKIQASAGFETRPPNQYLGATATKIQSHMLGTRQLWFFFSCSLDSRTQELVIFNYF